MGPDKGMSDDESMLGSDDNWVVRDWYTVRHGLRRVWGVTNPMSVGTHRR